MDRWRWKLDQVLRTSHSHEVELNQDHRHRLEEELATEYREHHAPMRRWTKMFDPRIPKTRWAMMGIALILAGVAACATPTTTELEMGSQLRFTISANDAGYEELSKIVGQSKELVEFLQGRHDVDEVSVSVSETVGAPVSVDLLLWGQGLDAHGIARDLQKAYPALASAEIETNALHSKIRESFGAKLSRSVLNLDINVGSEEEMRAQVLEQLAAQGFDGDAQVEMQQDGDMTTIGVELSSEGNEELIELITDGEPLNIELQVGGEEDGQSGVHEEVEVRRQK